MGKKVIAIFLFLAVCFVTLSCAQSQAPKNPKPAADFILPDLNGKEVMLSQYKNKQPVLLVFWTIWCPYCRQQLNKLKEKSTELEKAGIQLLAINVAEADYKVADFAQRFGIKYTILLDKNSTAADAFGLLGVPTYVLIDQQGRIVYNGNTFPQNYKALVS